MLRFEHPTSESKTKMREISINTGLAGVFHPLRPMKSHNIWTIHAFLTIVCSLLSYIPLDPVVAISILLIIINLGVNIAFLVLLFKARTRYQSAPSYNA